MKTTKKWNHQLGVSLGDGPLGKNHNMWFENCPQKRIPKKQIWNPSHGEAMHQKQRKQSPDVAFPPLGLASLFSASLKMRMAMNLHINGG